MEISLRHDCQGRQIARAAKAGLGMKKATDIEIVPDGQAGKRYTDKLRQILAKG